VEFNSALQAKVTRRSLTKPPSINPPISNIGRLIILISLQPDRDKAADGFGATGQVLLLAAPVVQER